MTSDAFDLLHPISKEHVNEPPKDKSPLVSVVVPCCGQLEYTRMCIDSLLRKSRRPYELIFVDLESMDGTTDYLAGFLAAAGVPVQVLRMSGSACFADAINRGISLANGEYVVLLSNDTIVTSFWLEHLLALADSSPTIGVVGGMSNCAPAPQSVGAIPYRLATRSAPGDVPVYAESRLAIDTEAVHRFAEQWTKDNRGQWFVSDRLSPFCLLFTHQALIRILPFEPDSFFTLNTEAAFRRLREFGFQIACCKDLYIHYFASRPLSSDNTKWRS
jgi:GT2 family glycosyltransferase